MLVLGGMKMLTSERNRNQQNICAIIAITNLHEILLGAPR